MELSVLKSNTCCTGAIGALESRGVIQCYWVSPDPSIFGREDLLVFFARDRTREEAVKALGTRDVAWVAWKVDGGLTVQVWPSDRRPRVDELASAVGVGPSGTAWVEHRTRPDLSLVDWRIIDALLDHPRMLLEELSESTGLSPKTVRKHLGMLLRDELIYVTPKVGALADSGELVYHSAVTGKRLERATSVVGGRGSGERGAGATNEVLALPGQRSRRCDK